eukprot:UN09816
MIGGEVNDPNQSRFHHNNDDDIEDDDQFFVQSAHRHLSSLNNNNNNTSGGGGKEMDKAQRDWLIQELTPDQVYSDDGKRYYYYDWKGYQQFIHDEEVLHSILGDNYNNNNNKDDNTGDGCNIQ